MKKTTWLLVALLISWTFNVALTVVLFLKMQYPQGTTFNETSVVSPRPPRMRPPKGMHHLQEFRQKMEPLRIEQQRLMMDLADLWADARLDTMLVNLKADSLESINVQMHRNHVLWMNEMHSKIPPEARMELAPRLTDRMRERGFRRDARQFRIGNTED